MDRLEEIEAQLDRGETPSLAEVAWLVSMLRTLAADLDQVGPLVAEAHNQIDRLKAEVARWRAQALEK